MGRMDNKPDAPVSEQLKRTVKPWQEIQGGSRQEYNARRKEEARQQTMAAHELFERVTNPGLSVNQLMEGARRNQERQIEAAISQSRQREQQTKQQYEDYKKSEQRQKDWEQSVAEALGRVNIGQGDLDLQLQKLPETTQNQKEKELSATADYYEHQRKAAEDWGVLNKDLAEIQTMPQEDVKLLETYANGRDEWFDTDVIGASIGARADLEAKYGKERTAELVESFQRYRNQRAAQRMQEETTAHIGQKGPGAEIGHSAASVAANAVGAVSAPLGYIKEAFGKTGRYQTLDPNNAGAIFNQYASTVRQETAKSIEGEDGGLLRKGAAIGYQGLMGAADNVVRIAMGGGTKVGSLGLAALGSFGSTVQEASAGGATPGQAILLGVASAGLEMLTEKYSIEKILSEAKAGKGLKHLLKEAAKAGAIEVTEEEASFLGNLAAEALILRENSSYNRQIGELVANGMSYQEAKEQADRQLWNEAAQTAAQSFISGGLIEGGKQALATAGNQASTAEATINKQKANVSKPEANSADGQYDIWNEEEFASAPAAPSDITDGTLRGFFETATKVLSEEQTAQETPAVPTDEMVREAMAEMFPSEPSAHERMEELGARMQGMIDRGELQDQEGQERYMALAREWEELDRTETDRADSLSREEAPPLREMTGNPSAASEMPGSPLTGRTQESVGSRSVKAYQYENPEVKPYFQDAARGLLYDINNSLPGQKSFDEDLHYQSGGEKGWSGTKRTTTDDLADLKDTYGYTWNQLREAAEDIIHDRGRENNAASKRLEFLIHDRLANGYKDVEGRPIPANRDYLDFLEERQVNEYRQGALDALMEEADRYAPAEAGEGFEAMGAASYGFSGKTAYDRLLTDENVQPVRSWAQRPMEVPIRDASGKRVTEFAANAAGAAATNDAMADALAQLIGEEKMSFASRSQQQSMENAKKALEKRPLREIADEIVARVDQDTIKDGDVEKALMIYNLWANDGTAEGQASAKALLPVLGKMANISGRNLNMFGILKKLDPNMQVQAVQDDINRTVKELNKERSGSSVIEGEQMRINEDLAEVFKEAETEEEKAKALDDIYKDIASRIKPTVWEMWDAWRNLAMLGNFKTHIRNFLGSGAFRPSVNAKRAVGAALERVFVDQENRTKALIGTSAQDKALLAWAKQDAKDENIQKMMQYSGTTGNEVRSAIEEQRRYLPGKLEDVRRFNMEKMEQADMAWKKREYALALAGFLKARGYTAKQAAMDIMTPGGVPTEVMDEARSYAAKEAMKATFNDRNRFSDAVARLRVKGNKPLDRAANIVLKGVLPFTRTPANVQVRAVEYSPAGLAEGFRQLAQDVKTGDATVADGLDKIASGLTGTGAMVLGAALAYGLIPGVKLIGRLDEEEKEEDPDAIEYSLKIGDKYYGISWLAPGAIPLLIGANFYQSIQDKEEITDGWDVLSAMGGTVADTLDPLLELSMLSSLNDLVETVRYEDSPGEMALAAVTNAATNYFTQGLPTLFGQIEQATEKTKSSVYSNADNPMQRSFERTVGRATQRIPGIDLYQTERLDAQGNPVENGPWYQRAFDALINPFTHSESGETPVTKELSRLDVTAPTVSKTVTYTDDQGNKREDYRLSAEEFSNMQRIQLVNSNRIMSEMLESSDYEKLPDDLKEKALEYVKDYARELARGEVLSGYDGKSSWMEGIEGKEAAAIIGKVAGSELSDAMTALATSWREGYADDSGALEGLENAAKIFEALTPEMRKTVKEGLSGRVAAYLEAKEKGMATDTFANLYRKYWDIDRSGAGASEQAKKWAYELERAEERREITARQKTALKNSLRFYQNFPAETEKFDQLTESGLSADEAYDLGWLLKGLEVQEGYKEVRDIQKAQAICEMSGLSEQDRIAALKTYGSDSQDENLDQMLELGYTSQDYLNAWKLISDEKDKGGTGTKRRTINALAQMYGVSTAKATEIYEVWYPKSK